MPSGGPTTQASLIVRRVAGALVLRTSAEPAAELTGFATRLPAEPGRTAVIIAPSVAGRADLSAVLRDVVIEHLGGSAGGIRLVPLGDLPAPAEAAALGRSIAEQIGQEVVLPGSGGGWLLCRPGQPAHNGPPWPPRPGVGPAVRPPRASRLARRRPSLVWRPALPTPAPAPTAPDADGQPAGPPLGAGWPTAAGWSFRPEQPDGGLRSLSAFVVEVPISASGCQVAGRPVPPRRLARLIAQGRDGQTHRPVVLSVAGPDIAPSAAEALFGGIAAALGEPILVAGHPVACTATGLLSAAGGFSRWPAPDDAKAAGRGAPRAGSIGLPGPVWPELPRGRRFTVARRSAPCPQPITPAPAALLDPDRWRAVFAPVAVPHVPAALAMLCGDAPGGVFEPETIPAPGASLDPAPLGGMIAAALGALTPAVRPAPVAAVVRAVVPHPAAVAGEPESVPRWLDLHDGAAIDRPGLRQALNGSYDAHARVVARTLAEQPGLRAAGGRNDLVTGLVALRAYCVAERVQVNQVLRGEPAAEPVVERAERVARCAVYGLSRLPAVFGPVFLDGPAGPAGADPPPVYRSGDEIVEPGFLDVDLAAGGSADAAVQFVIWSVSARRLAALGTGDRAGLFPPGTRFSVLAVDPGTPDSPARVHLRDLTGGPAGSRGGIRPEDNEQILGRLRAAGHDSPGAIGARGVNGEAPAVQAAFLPGLDAARRHYRRPSDPVDGPSNGGAVLLRRTER